MSDEIIFRPTKIGSEMEKTACPRVRGPVSVYAALESRKFFELTRPKV